MSEMEKMERKERIDLI